MEKFKKLSKEEMKKVVGGTSTPQKFMCCSTKRDLCGACNDSGTGCGDGGVMTAC